MRIKKYIATKTFKNGVEHYAGYIKTQKRYCGLFWFTIDKMTVTCTQSVNGGFSYILSKAFWTTDKESLINILNRKSDRIKHDIEVLRPWTIVKIKKEEI